MVLIIGFIVYSGFKKQKKEKKERKKREKEVKDLIKNFLKKNNNLHNVVVEYLDVKPRIGKHYKSRDVYDVFVKIINPKTNLVITKKAYEIEGSASFEDNNETASKKDKAVVVDWNINKEFKYNNHKNIIDEEISSQFGIYLKSVFKKNRKKYINKQLKKIKKLEIEKKKIHKDVKKTDDFIAFKPEIKKKNEQL